MKREALFRITVGMLLIATCSAQAGEADAMQLVRGKTLFEHRCGMCHLDGQTGAVILERRLGKERALLASRSDLAPAYVRQVVRGGLMNMPRLSRVEIPDSDLNDVIAYLNRPKTLP